MERKAPRHQRLIPFPAFSYAFIQRGANHTRTLATWALLQKTGLEALQRRQVITIICQRMGLSPKQARCILRRGDTIFWDVVCGMVYPRSAAHIASLIRSHRLARIVKRSKMYVPERALRNLTQLRAHLSLAVISRSPDLPTPRAYTATCLSRSRNTVSIYRAWLREAGFISTTSIWIRIPVAAQERKPRSQRGLYRGRCKRQVPPLQAGEFLSSDGHWVVRRGPDIVEINLANIFRVDKGLRPIDEEVEFGRIKYKTAILPTPVCLPRAPPGRKRADREMVKALRQENRIIAPRLPLLPQAEGVIMRSQP